MINDFNQTILKISKNVYLSIKLILNKNKRIFAIFGVVERNKNNEIIKQKIQDLIRYIRKSLSI